MSAARNAISKTQNQESGQATSAGPDWGHADSAAAFTLEEIFAIPLDGAERTLTMLVEHCNDQDTVPIIHQVAKIVGEVRSDLNAFMNHHLDRANAEKQKASTGDAELLGLANEWWETVKAANEPGLSDDERDAYLEPQSKIIDRIAALSAKTPTGALAKLAVLVDIKDMSLRRPYEGDAFDGKVEASLFRDAINLLPPDIDAREGGRAVREMIQGRDPMPT